MNKRALKLSVKKIYATILLLRIAMPRFNNLV